MAKPSLHVKCERRAAKISRIFGANFLFSLCVSTAFSQNITLTTSANPSTFGQSVTLTATVSPSAAIGKVTFYDGTTVLGTSTLSAGKAALSTILLPSGTRSLRAYFLGGNGNAPATSTVLSQTVNAVAASGFSAPSNYTAAYYPNALAVADFNGDGKADLMVADITGIQVLLGNGDGTLQPAIAAVTYPAAGAGGIVVGDFNEDGIPDLVFTFEALINVVLGNGDGTFRAAVTYPLATGQEASSFVAGDFNGDGNADLVASSDASENGTVTVFLGNGDGTFQAPVNYAAGEYAGSVAVGDFNGDGKADLVVTNGSLSGNGTVSVLLGNGDGSFQPPLGYPASADPSSIAVADFNGDGKLDLALTNPGNGGDITVLLGNGDGSFQPPADYGANADPLAIAAGDINGDGRVDIVVAAADNYAAGVLLGNGDGTFQPIVYYWLGVLPQPVTLANFNGDGRADLAVGNLPGSVSILSGHAPSSGRTFTSIAISTSSNPAIAGQSVTMAAQVSPSTATGTVTFLDGSTALGGDILTGGMATLAGSIFSAGAHSLTAVYGGDASDAFSTSPVFLETIDPISTATALFSSPNPSNSGQSIMLRATVEPSGATGSVTFMDGSTPLGSGTLAGGETTLAVSTLSTGTHSLTAVYNGDANDTGSTSPVLTQTVYAARATTTTTLATSPNPSTFGQSVTLTATVSPSIATGCVTFYDGVTVLETEPISGGQATLKTTLPASGARAIRAFYGGDSNHSPSTSTTLNQAVNPVIANRFAYAGTYATTAFNPESLAVGDFNGDGKTDFAAAVGGYVDVFLGNGDGTFQAPGFYPTSTVTGQPYSVVAADFNSDGKPDLAVASSSGIAILLGNGDGTFQPAVDYSIGGGSGLWSLILAVSDFNADGQADLVTSNSDGSLSVLLGKGDGTFLPAVNLNANQTGSAALAIGDFNGDGIPDLATGSLSVWLGNGDGSFRAGAGYTIANSVSSMAAGDFNGDGKMDLAVIFGVDIGVLMGNGDGTFQPLVTYAVGSLSGSALGSMAVGDFNGDGRLDLVVTGSYSGFFFTTTSADVLLGNGDGTFEAPVSYAGEIGSGFVAVADFNGDGRADLAVVDYRGSNVGILLGVFLQSQTITFGPLSNREFGSTPLTLNATASSGLGVIFFSNNSNVCSISEVTLTLLSAGTCSITASQPGNSTYSAATPVTQTFTVFGLSQTISFGPLSNQILGSSPPPLSATASSGLAVTFTSNSLSVCTVYGVDITLVALGTCSITASQPGDGTWAEAPLVTQTFQVTLPVEPVAAFLDQNGAPALTFNGSTSFPDAGGFLIGAPGVAQASNGDTYVVGLDSAGGVHLNSYSFASGTWNGWQYSGGILDTTSGLTAAVDSGGVVWFTGRDIGNRYWINSWNGIAFGGWVLLDQGIFASDSVPQIAIPSDGSIYVIGKDIGGRIWSNSYIPTSQTFTGWVDRQAVMIGQPSATAGQDGMVYVAVRDAPSNSSVYITQIPAQNAATANTWLKGGGLIDTDPQITSQGGTVYLTALAGSGTVYLLTFTESNQAFGTWSFTNGTLNDETIAAAAGNVFIAGRDTGDRLYWYSVTGNTWFLAGGAGISSTVLTGGK